MTDFERRTAENRLAELVRLRAAYGPRDQLDFAASLNAASLERELGELQAELTGVAARADAPGPSSAFRPRSADMNPQELGNLVEHLTRWHGSGVAGDGRSADALKEIPAQTLLAAQFELRQCLASVEQALAAAR